MVPRIRACSGTAVLLAKTSVGEQKKTAICSLHAQYSIYLRLVAYPHKAKLGGVFGCQTEELTKRRDRLARQLRALQSAQAWMDTFVCLSLVKVSQGKLVKFKTVPWSRLHLFLAAFLLPGTASRDSGLQVLSASFSEF